MTDYETHRMKDPRLPFIFYTKTKLRADNLRSIQPNWHENVEILQVLQGHGYVDLDAMRYEIKAGDIVIINANCLHCVHTDAPLLIYNCLIVDHAFCLANYFDSSQLCFSPVVRDEELSRTMLLLEDEYTPPFREAFRVQTIRALVLQILARLCREHGLDTDDAHRNADLLSCIKQAIGYIRTRSDEDISLDEVAKFAGLSKYYFAREFHRITGHTFVSYVNLIRCERAKQMLRENRTPIGEIGRACGFENQSYFSKIFRSYTGHTPSDYRERTDR